MFKSKSKGKIRLKAAISADNYYVRKSLVTPEKKVFFKPFISPCYASATNQANFRLFTRNQILSLMRISMLLSRNQNLYIVYTILKLLFFPI